MCTPLQERDTNRLHEPEPLLLECLRKSVGDLYCTQHATQELTHLSIESGSLLCEECLTNNKEPPPSFERKGKGYSKLQQTTIKLSQFIEHPVLAFLSAPGAASTQQNMLREIVCQCNSLFARVETEADTSSALLNEYLNNLVRWVSEEAEQIRKKFEQRVEKRLTAVREHLDGLQNVVNIYKDGLENLVAAREIDSRTQLEEVCAEFLNNSEDPSESLLQHYSALEGTLASMPELNVQSFKELYCRVTDSFRLSYEYLIKSGAQREVRSVEELQRRLELVSVLQTSDNTVSDYTSSSSSSYKNETDQEEGTAAVAASVNISKIIEIDEKNFLSLEERSLKLWCVNDAEHASEGCAHSRCEIRKTRTILDAICFKNKKFIAIGTDQYIEIFSMSDGKAVFRDAQRPTHVLQELPGHKLLAGGASSLSIYSFENHRNIHKISELTTQIEQICCVDFAILPSGVIEGELLALAGSNSPTLELYQPLPSGTVKHLRSVETNTKNKTGFVQLEWLLGDKTESSCLLTMNRMSLLMLINIAEASPEGGGVAETLHCFDMQRGRLTRFTTLGGGTSSICTKGLRLLVYGGEQGNEKIALYNLTLDGTLKALGELSELEGVPSREAPEHIVSTDLKLIVAQGSKVLTLDWV